jgi:MFS transporter, NNP family, nitrate/nitrite transporter
MAAALGAGSGAVFSLVAMLAPADKIASVTGVVGAIGGLGGFVPPLIMGLVYSQFHDYAVGLVALAVVAAAALALALAVTGVRAALAAR